jgi:hypothetical protein
MPDGIGATPPPSIVDSVAALARQVERLAAEVANVERLREDVHGLTLTVAGIADELAHADIPGEDAAPSWLWPAEPMRADDAASVLAQLVRWAGRVYLRYADGGLPECWLWHPEVIEELLWLHAAWQSAYLGATASAQRAADWHDRQRPGVVRRVRAVAGSCSLREHFEQPRTPGVPAADAAPAIAAWWAEPGREAPVPSSNQIRIADAAHRKGAAAAWGDAGLAVEAAGEGR